MKIILYFLFILMSHEPSLLGQMEDKEFLMEEIKKLIKENYRIPRETPEIIKKEEERIEEENIQAYETIRNPYISEIYIILGSGIIPVCASIYLLRNHIHLLFIYMIFPTSVFIWSLSLRNP